MVSSIKIVGVHRVIPTEALRQDAREGMFGISVEELDPEVEAHIDLHFSGLYVIEIEIEPGAENLDWSEITQVDASRPRSSWQVPYDEQSLDPSGNRWAFFFHYLDVTVRFRRRMDLCRSLKPTPLPKHLRKIKDQYSAP